MDHHTPTFTMTTALRSFLWTLLLLITHGLGAQTVEDNWWIPNNTVNAIARDSATGTVYLGGDFTTVAAPVRYGAALDPTSGMPEVTWAKPNAPVFEAIPDGIGGWFIGGSFTQVGSSARVGIARLNSDGTVHPFVCGITGQVIDMALSNDTLYLGGTFVSTDLPNQRNILAVNANTGVPYSMFLGGVNNAVRALEKAGTTVFAGGDFTYPNGDGPYLSQMDKTTLITDWTFVKPNGLVNCAVPDGAGGWYIGGQFSTVGGVARTNVARINSNGTLNSWNPVLASTGALNVHALELVGSVVYIGGEFSTVNGAGRGCLVAVDATTGATLPFFNNMAITPGWKVEDLQANGGELIVGGRFPYVGAQEPYGAKLDAGTGTPDFNYLNPNGTVNVVIPDGSGGWYVGGGFSQFGGVSRLYLVRVNSDGTLNAWNPNVTGGFAAVNALLLDGTTLYVGGSFTGIGGQSRRFIGAVSTVTGLATAFNANNIAGNVVYSIAKDGSNLYLGGSFNDMGGDTRQNIAAVDATTGNAIPNWRYATNNTVRALTTDGGQVYAGGDFTQLGLDRPYGTVVDPVTAVPDFGYLEPNQIVNVTIPDGSGGWYIGGGFTRLGTVARNYIAHLNADGSLDPWNPNVTGQVLALLRVGSTLYVGGNFNNIGGQARSHLGAVNTTTGLATGFNAFLNNPVNSLATDGSLIYAGGQFTTVGSPAIAHSYFVSLDPVTGARATELAANGQVYALKSVGGTLYAGGNFTELGRPVTGAVVVTTSNSTFNANTVRPNGDVRCSAPDGAGGWYIGGTFTTVGGVTRNRLARINADGTLNAWNPNADQAVFSMTVSGGIVYVGGIFSNIGASSRSRIAAIDGTTGIATAWNPGTSGQINALEVVGSVVYAGGIFSSIGGQSRSLVAGLDIATGLATAWNANMTGSYVYALEASGSGTIYIGGGFTNCGGAGRNNAAEVSLATGLATAWNPNPGAPVNVLKVFDASSVFMGENGGAGLSKRNRISGAIIWNFALVAVQSIDVDASAVYFGGSFSLIAGSQRLRAASADANTGALLPWDPSISGGAPNVLTISISGTDVLLGGQFSMGNVFPRSRLAEIVPGTATCTTWNPALNNIVYALDANATTVYAGGDFTTAGGAFRNYIAALDRTTGLSTAWNPGSSHSVRALSLHGATGIYVGGYFSTIGSASRGLIAELDLTTGFATAWDPSADVTGSTRIEAIGYDGTRVYFGGQYTWLKQATRNRLSAFDLATGDVAAWNPNSNGQVFALAGSGSNVYAGGAFTTVGGQTRNRIAALDATTGLATVWNPNADGDVYGLLIDGSTVYAGGAFLNMGGLERGRLAAIDIATALPTAWDPSADYHVRCFAKQGTNVYVGGDFLTIGGKLRSGLFSIDQSTSVISAWDPRVSAGNSIHTMLMDGGLLYVGGFFGAIKGVAKQSIAAVDLVTGVPTAWAPSCNLEVYAMQKSGSTVYVGGSFTSLGGQARNYLGGVDAGTGLATSWNPAPNNVVHGLTLDGNDLYIGGVFTSITATPRNRAAAINTISSTLLPWNPGADGEVSDITFSGTKALLTGGFSNIGGPLRSRLASWNTTTGALNAFDPAPNNIVHDLKWDSGTLYCAGQFSILASTTRNNIGAVNATTGALTSWNPSSSGAVYKLGISGSSLYAGGLFFSIGGQSRSRVAEVSLVTGLASSWNPTVSGGASTVNDLYVSPTSVFVSGNFTTIAGQPRNHLAAIDRTTGAATSWNPTPNAQCFGITGDGVHVYVGGDFTTIGQVARNRICALDANGNLSAWNPGSDNSIRSLALDANIVYAGGLFTNIGGQARNRIAAISRATGLASAWNPNANGTEVAALAVRGSTVYAGGDFTTIGGQTRNRIAALDASTGLATAWNPNGSNTVRAILPTATTIYAAGLFTTIGGQTRNRIAALDATTGLSSAWNPNANNTVLGLSLSGSTLYAAGFFTTIGGQTRNRIAALDLNTGLATSWNPNSDNAVNAVSRSGSLVAVGGTFGNVGGSARARLAVLDNTTGGTTAWNLGPITGIGVNAVVTDGLRIFAGGNFTAFGGSTHNYFGVTGLCPNPLTYYYDGDGDGLGDPSMDSTACEQPAGYVLDSTDGCPLAVEGITNFDTNTCNCNLGYFQVTTVMGPNTVITACTVCPVGSYCPDGVDALPCQAGYYSDNLGQIVCSACAPGRFSNTTGSISCTLCPANTYNPVSAATSCIPCDIDETSAPGATECVPDIVCTTTLNLIFNGDGATSVNWELRQQITDIVVQSGVATVYPSLTFTPEYQVSTCLPDGDFYLVVTSNTGGIVQGGVQGGYRLQTAAGVRLVDNRNNFLSGATSQIAGGQGFSLPVGTDRLIYVSCDKMDWRTGEYIVANDNAAVAGYFGGANAAQTGYEMWFYNPNGGYSFRRFHSHAVSDGFAPNNPQRACHIRVNGWGGVNTIPAQSDLLNVKVRGRVMQAGLPFNLPWGPACRFKMDANRAECPLTQLMDIPGSVQLSCGGTRPIGSGGGSLVHARPVNRYLGGVSTPANRYQFRFRITDEFIDFTKTSLTGQYWVNTLTLAPCKTYKVEVRASFDNGVTYCDTYAPANPNPYSPLWGRTCLLTTSGPLCPPMNGGGQNMATDGSSFGSAQDGSPGQLRLYPNPNNGEQLFLSIDMVKEGVEKVNVDIFDTFGKRVNASTIAVNEGFVNTTLDLNGSLAAGMYIVNITAGDDTYTERLVIQP